MPSSSKANRGSNGLLSARVIRAEECSIVDDWLISYRLLIDQATTEGIALCLMEYEPGQQAPLHSHGPEDEYYKDEIYIVLSGSGEVTLERTSHAVAPGDVVWIPRGTPHGVDAGPEGLRLWAFVAWLDLLREGRPGAATSH